MRRLVAAEVLFPVRPRPPSPPRYPHSDVIAAWQKLIAG
jgi:hypothetical protein